MSCDNCKRQMDFGSNPYVVNVGQLAKQNMNFRIAVWTGHHLQMTVMCIPPCEEIGVEVHPETDQFIRVEQGNGLAQIGKNKNQLDFQQRIGVGDGVFVPAGCWHNVVNVGREPLKLSTIYAPPKHPKGIIHPTKQDAEKEDGY